MSTPGTPTETETETTPTETTPIEFEPATWYSATFACRSEGCIHQDVVQDAPLLYSNDGIYVRIYCTPCDGYAEILSVTKLDPQPVFDE